MTSSLSIKGSTILHAIAFTVALALVSSNYNWEKGRTANDRTIPVLQVQPTSDNVAITPKFVGRYK